MQITVNVKEADIKAALEYMVENDIYDQFDSEVLKKAKVPSKAALVKELIKDPEVIKAVTKVVEKIEVVEYLYDNLYDYNIKRVKDLYTACDTAAESLEDEREAEAKAAQEKAELAKEEEIMKRTIKALERQGYKLVKA